MDFKSIAALPGTIAASFGKIALLRHKGGIGFELLSFCLTVGLVLGNARAVFADDKTFPDDIIFDGSRLVTPIPHSRGNPTNSEKAPSTSVTRPASGEDSGSFQNDLQSSNGITSSGDTAKSDSDASKSDTRDANLDSAAGFDPAAKPDPAAKAANPDSEARLVRKAERKIERDLAQSEQDLTMYQQMSQVINWLNQYCVWNHHWPEPIDETNQAVNQLCELVPNNPYKWKSKVQEAQGQSTDPDYLYLNQPMNQPTDASTGFEGDSPDPGTSFEALGNKRIKLVFNPSLTVAEVQQWETDPPAEWVDEPGTITGISNSQNLIVVWGAGADGKPLRVPGSRKTRIFVSNVQMSETGNENQ